MSVSPHRRDNHPQSDEEEASVPMGGKWLAAAKGIGACCRPTLCTTLFWTVSAYAKLTALAMALALVRKI